MGDKVGIENRAYEDIEAQFTVSENDPKRKNQNPLEKSLEETKTEEVSQQGWWTPGRRITKDVVVLSVAYLLLFTAFKGAANLQSSVNAGGGLGTSALMAYYAGFIISSIFLPAALIRVLGCKWTMTACAVAYAPFMAANLDAQFYTLVPGALIAGAGAGPAWCSLSTFTSLAGERQARAAVGGSSPSTADIEAATAKLYSMFYTVYQLNQVSGNLLSSLVLSTGLEYSNDSKLQVPGNISTQDSHPPPGADLVNMSTPSSKELELYPGEPTVTATLWSLEVITSPVDLTTELTSIDYETIVDTTESFSSETHISASTETNFGLDRNGTDWSTSVSTSETTEISHPVLWENSSESTVTSVAGIAMIMEVSEDSREGMEWVNGTLTDEQICGASLCGEDSVGSSLSAPPPLGRLQVLCGTYLLCVVLSAALLAFGVGNIRREGTGSEAEQPTALALLAATLQLLRRRRLLLLLPIFIFFGAEKAFVGAEFTAGYVSCVSGVGSIGFVMICYGVTNSGASAAAGWVMRAGRRRVLASTVALHGALLASLLAWAPRPGAAPSHLALYALSALWGVVDGFWLVQINTLVSLLFPGDEEAAFSNYHLWESAGYIMAYGYSAHLCIYVKLYVLLALLAVGVGCFSAIEVHQERRTRRQQLKATDSNSKEEAT